MSKDDFSFASDKCRWIWIHYYEPENKAQSRHWVGPGSPRPKKFKTQPSASKVIATVFWDAKGVIMLGFLPKRSTMECTMQTYYIAGELSLINTCVVGQIYEY